MGDVTVIEGVDSGKQRGEFANATMQELPCGLVGSIQTFVSVPDDVAARGGLAVQKYLGAVLKAASEAVPALRFEAQVGANVERHDDPAGMERGRYRDLKAEFSADAVQVSAPYIDFDMPVVPHDEEAGFGGVYSGLCATLCWPDHADLDSTRPDGMYFAFHVNEPMVWRAGEQPPPEHYPALLERLEQFRAKVAEYYGGDVPLTEEGRIALDRYQRAIAPADRSKG